MDQEVKKEYVSVVAQIQIDGAIVPLAVILEDGREYEVDDLMDVCKAREFKSWRLWGSVHDKNSIACHLPF